MIPLPSVMRNALSQALKIVFSPESILPFLVSSVFLAVLGNAVYTSLNRNCINAIDRTRLPKGWHYPGMTAYALMGMVLMCVGSDRPLQYTSARFNQQQKIVGSLNPIRIWLHREVVK